MRRTRKWPFGIAAGICLLGLCGTGRGAINSHLTWISIRQGQAFNSSTVATAGYFFDPVDHPRLQWRRPDLPQGRVRRCPRMGVPGVVQQHRGAQRLRRRDLYDQAELQQRRPGNGDRSLRGSWR
jgi:hypothetical protein